MAMRDRDLMMFLACIFSMSLFASCLEFSRAKPPYFDRHKSSEENSEVGAVPENPENEGGSSEEEETYKVVRRAVRKYPEEAEDNEEYRHHRYMEMEHHQASLRNSDHDCDCPDMLAKGTLIVIVATLAFLIIFSSSIQLVVAVCILRLVKKQRKMEKEAKPHSHSSHHRKHHHPPAPPPRPEKTYMTMKAQGYERFHLASPRANQGVYLSASELHPGPRLSQEKRYQNVGGSPQVDKSTPENKYIVTQATLFSPTLSQEKRYQNVGGSPQVDKNEGTPEAVASPKKRETHFYEEVE